MPGRCMLLIVLLLALHPLALLGQGVEGRVLEADSHVPVPGAFVVLLDGEGRRAAAGLSGDDGAYSLAAPRPGTYRVRVQRIGYRSTTTAPFELPAQGLDSLVVQVPGEAVALEPLRVEGEARCVLRPEEGGATHRLWTEVKKALEVAEWTVRGRPLVYDLLLFDRLVDDGTGVVSSERVERYRLTSERPFITDHPDSLARLGYARREPRGFAFFGPDASVLLSDAFVDTHCFRRVPGGSALVGLAFSPVRDSIPEVRGTLWLHRESRELESLEFRYVRPPIPLWVEAERYGGSVRFRRLPDGAWIISHWKIRSPAFRRTRGRWEHVGFNEAEGDLLALEDTAGTPIPHERAAALLVGQVLEPGSGRPVVGAEVRIEGTPYHTTTDGRGRFAFSGLPAGRYRVLAEHRSLGRSGVGRVVELGRDATTKVRVGGGG